MSNRDDARVPAAEALRPALRRAREEGARILAEARADYPDNPDFVAAQRLAPYPQVPDTFTHERIAAALVAARREERERCARAIEARACQLRDHGPATPEGLLTALAGAQVGALLDAAISLRGGAARPGPREGGHHFQEEDGYPGSLLAGSEGDAP